jgi:hypothetical protein
MGGKARAATGPPSSLPTLALINEGNIDAVEEQALQMVNRTISALEEAMAAWEGAADKPGGLKDKYGQYVKLHAELSAWGRKFLLSRKEERTLSGRLALIEELSLICRAYSEVQ